MAYATVQDMIDAVGERELVQLSTPDGADMAGVVADRVQLKLDEASGVIDSHLRRRYQTPLPASPELRGCCCTLARYLLSFNGSTQPSEQVRLAYKAAMAWLGSISDGHVTLDGEAPPGNLPGPRVQDRCPTFRGDGRLRW